MNNSNISFVILHYQSLNITIKCIEYVKSLNSPILKNIVVVDNGSPNKSGEKLRKLFGNEKKIFILINSSNEGFAGGNNRGYEFAKKQLKSDLIIVMNNDVMIKQYDFISLLVQKTKKNKVHIIVPDIVTSIGVHQNPYRKNTIRTLEIIYILFLNFFNRIVYSIPIISRIFFSFNNSRPSLRKRNEKSWINKASNIVPHGAFLVYTREWIEREDIAFLPKSFMYLEEYILYEYIIIKNYDIEYIPDLVVRHLEDVSTDSVHSTPIEKARFKAVHATDSALELLKMRFCKK